MSDDEAGARARQDAHAILLRGVTAAKDHGVAVVIFANPDGGIGVIAVASNGEVPPIEIIRAVIGEAHRHASSGEPVLYAVNEKLIQRPKGGV